MGERRYSSTHQHKVAVSDKSRPDRFFFFWRFCPTRAIASSFLRFLDHTQRRSTVGRTRLNERSARHTDLFLPTRNNHQTPCPRWDSNPQLSRRAAADLPLLPHSPCDRHPTDLPGRNILPYVLNSRLGGPHSPHGQFEEE